MRTKFLATIGLSLCLSGCMMSSQTGGTGSLADLQALGSSSAQRAHTIDIGHIRYMALKDTALSIGARSGLAWRAKKLDDLLQEESKELFATYDFRAMLLPHNVLPPVLAEGQDSLNLAGPDTIRLASQIYKIVQQARFVTAPPTWRDYLWMDYPKPEIPNFTLLPKNRRERRVWDTYIEKGWENGIEQANRIFEANLARLNRDYKGMALYRQLYAENMVSAPFVARTKLGITGNAENMRIGDQVLRITALPQLNLNGNTWHPIIRPTEPEKVLVQRQLMTHLKAFNGDHKWKDK